MNKLFGMMCFLVPFALQGASAQDAQVVNPEPITVSMLNDLVDQTNFIVGSGCSGTLISVEHRLIMTAGHCVDSKISFANEEKVVNGEVTKIKREIRRDVTVSQKVYRGTTMVGSSTYQADILAYSDNRIAYDLALLQVKSERIPMTLAIPILPKGTDAVRGSRVYVVGNPAGLDASITQGIIVSTSRELEASNGTKTAMLQTDAEVFFGNSGGVLMSDTGFYLGTVSRGIPGTAVIFAVHYKHVQELLTNACFGKLWNPDADDEKCRAKKGNEDGDSVKDILKKILDKK